MIECCVAPLSFRAISQIHRAQCTPVEPSDVHAAFWARWFASASLRLAAAGASPAQGPSPAPRRRPRDLGLGTSAVWAAPSAPSAPSAPAARSTAPALARTAGPLASPRPAVGGPRCLGSAWQRAHAQARPQDSAAQGPSAGHHESLAA